MNSRKKKSPGWRDVFKRRTPEQYRAMRATAAAATAQRDCNRRGVWHACPQRRCRRAECCSGEPAQCQARGRPAVAQQRNITPPAAKVAAETATPQRGAAARSVGRRGAGNVVLRRPYRTPAAHAVRALIRPREAGEGDHAKHVGGGA
jgi:hypothetical protein